MSEDLAVEQNLGTVNSTWLNWAFDSHTIGDPHWYDATKNLVTITYQPNGVSFTLNPLKREGGDINWYTWQFIWDSSKADLSTGDLSAGRVECLANGRREIWWDDVRPNCYWRMTLTPIIGDAYYTIPNIWVQSDNKSYQRIVGNMGTYDALHLSHAGYAIQVYGYRNGNEKDPYLIELSTIQVGKDTALSGKVLEPISSEAPDAYQVMFNWLLAKKRDELLVWNFDVSKLIKSAPIKVGVKDYIALGAKDMTLKATDIQVIDKSVLTADQQYVNQSILRNATDAACTMKTSDYTHTWTDTWEYTYAMSQKLGVKTGLKITVDGGVSFLMLVDEKVKVEMSLELSLELNFSQQWKWGHTDTKTYLVGGQTIAVPPKSTIEVNTSWYHANIAGHIEAYAAVPVDYGVTVFANQVNRRSEGLSAVLDLQQAAAMLGLPNLVVDPKVNDKVVKGLYLKTPLTFNTNLGVKGAYNVEQLEFVPTPPKELQYALRNTEVEPLPLDEA